MLHFQVKWRIQAEIIVCHWHHGGGMTRRQVVLSKEVHTTTIGTNQTVKGHFFIFLVP